MRTGIRGRTPSSMRGLVILLAVMLGAALAGEAAAQDARPQDASAHLQPFYGVWKVDSVMYDNLEQMDATSRDKVRLSIENGEYKLFYVIDAAKGLGRKLASSNLTADPAKKTFELVFTEGPRKGEKVHGIYEVTSTKLKVCYCQSSKPLPTKFEAPKGSPYFSESWTREK